jgi:hypothetical protein
VFSASLFPRSLVVCSGSANALAYRRATQRAQAQLQHDRMIGLHISTVRIIRNVVQAQYEAIIDITEADAGLVEFSGIDVVAGGSQHDPIFVELDLSGSQNALLAFENADQRLCRVIAIEQAAAPTVELGAGFEFDALRGEVVVVQPEA